ncbi:MAG: GNAT family N-acetyltransferase [Paracoccaceae bacterium]
MTTPPIIETERLVLRPPEGRDWEPWAEFMASDRAAFVGGPQDRSAAWRAFGHIIGHGAMRGFTLFMVTRKGDDTALGSVGPWFPEGWPEREIGWTLWSGALEGGGFAFEAASAARAWIWSDLGWGGAVSYIAKENARSIALAQRLGAELDPAADTPRGEDCHVFRHQRPEAAV